MRALSLVALLGLLLAPAVHANIVFDNFGPGYDYNESVGNPVIGSAVSGDDEFDLAWGFTAAGSCGLDSILLAMSIVDQSVPVNQLALSLCGDATGQPGAVLESWIAPVPIGYGFGSPNPPLLVSSVLKPSLAAGSQYWLVSEAATAQSLFVWNHNSIGDMGPVAFRTNSGVWMGATDQRGAFQVNGTAEAIPEPATTALFGLGVVALVLRRRRRTP